MQAANLAPCDNYNDSYVYLFVVFLKWCDMWQGSLCSTLEVVFFFFATSSLKALSNDKSSCDFVRSHANFEIKFISHKLGIGSFSFHPMF